MGKQIQFIMDQEDEERFVNMILLEGIILYEGGQIPERIETLPKPFSGRGWFKLYLYKDEFGALVTNPINAERIIIDPIKSPVIEFTRTIVRNNSRNSKEVSRGRIWIEPKYYDDNRKIIDKDIQLEKWYKQLSAWIRKNLNHNEVKAKNGNFKVYCNPSMKELIESEYKIM